MRPWMHTADPMEAARAEGRRRLRDVPPARRAVLHLPRPRHRAGGRDARGIRTATSARSARSSRRRWRQPKVRLLWGTANLFSNRRYMAGAATNPDPDVFAYAAAQVKNVLELTHELGGANYVLWGGREGYETLLNTDIEARARPARPLPDHGGRAQAQDRLQGHDPDRAEAEGADQAPVRLRRRHHLRHAQGLRPRERGQDQHRAEPRHPRRPQLRARDRARRARSASSARSTSTAATICSAGTPTSSP